MMLPEVPGLPGACVFYPGLDDTGRRDYVPAVFGEAIGVTTPYRHDLGFSNWFWGITPSALRGMLDVAGLREERSYGDPFHRTLVLRRA
jgi:hypothetical protein